MQLVLKLFAFVFTLSRCESRAAAGSLQQMTDAKKYLLRYGYLDSFDVGDAGVSVSLKRLQHFANIAVTGRLDTATLRQMTIPRCGHQDPKLKITSSRRRRYVHQGTTWKKTLLTWRLDGRGRTLTRETIRRVMYKAFQLWNDHTNMNFREVSDNNPDIWVKFVTGNHGDLYPFDGQGGTLAHAFYPHTGQGLSGDVHFDDSEYYTYKSASGRNLLWVATHELGHTLGMEHSNVREAVMYPWYTKYKPGFKLNYDDIVGIQALYGSKIETTSRTTTTTTTTTTTAATTTRRTPRPAPSDRKCPSSTITAIYYNTYARYPILLTKAEKLYLAKPGGGIRYGPARATNYLPRHFIPDPIDAAFDTNKLNNRHQTIFFAGKNYYIFQHFRYQSGPHSIHGKSQSNPLNLKFPSWVPKIDAVMKWYRNGRTYFFAGRYYWRYDNDNKKFDSGYPRVTQSAWKGLPQQIDAAYSSDLEKKTFFISGNQYYLLNDYFVRVKTGYPEHVGREWLNCGGRSSMVGSVSSPGGLSVGETRIKGRDP